MLDYVSRLNLMANRLVWNLPLILMLVGSGLYLSIRLRGVQFRKFPHAIRALIKPPPHPKSLQPSNQDLGEITPFRALTTALAGTVGTGNIVGVAAAILLGGPGAIFWMWISAIIGMSTKFTSCTLAVHFRKIEPHGEVYGGPMYYIEKGLGPKFKWLAVLFALFTICASFGIGTTFQVNNFVTSLHLLFRGSDSIGPTLLFRFCAGLCYAFLLSVAIVGGVKQIGRVTAKLVPFMFLLYFVMGGWVLITHYQAILPALSSIFKCAFHNPYAIVGGGCGSVIHHGLARGLFSNEAGLGSAAIAHSAAHTKYPVRQGLIAMLGPFIDTILVCTMTALVILVTSSIDASHVKGELASVAFRIGLGHKYGEKSISLIILFLAFSTTISWSYYGDRASGYLFGKRGIKIYHLIYLATILVGACIRIDSVITFSDTANGLMAFPNLLAVLSLSPLVAKLVRNYSSHTRVRQ